MRPITVDPGGEEFTRLVAELRTEVDSRRTRARGRQQQSARESLDRSLEELDEQIQQLREKPMRTAEKGIHVARLAKVINEGVDRVDDRMRSHMSQLDDNIPLKSQKEDVFLTPELGSSDRFPDFPRGLRGSLNQAREIAKTIEQNVISRGRTNSQRPPDCTETLRIICEESPSCGVVDHDDQHSYRVKMKVLGASGLPDMSDDKWLGGCCDACARIVFNGEIIETAVVDNCREPVWESTRVFERIPKREVWFEVEVWDKRKGVVADVLIGQSEKQSARLDLHMGADIRVPIRNAYGEGNPTVTLRLEAERWTLVQFYVTALEAADGSHLDEDHLVKLSLSEDFNQTSYLRIPDSSVPIEVSTIEVPLSRSDSKVKAVARLMRRERWLIGDPVEHEVAIFEVPDISLESPLDTTRVLSTRDRQCHYELHFCSRLHPARENGFVVPPVPMPDSICGEYVNWNIWVDYPDRSSQCPVHDGNELVAEVRSSPFWQEEADGNCFVPGRIQLSGPATRNECEMVLIFRDSSSTDGVAFSRFIARESGPITLLLSTLCKTCCWTRVEISCELMPWIYIYLDTARGEVEVSVGDRGLRLVTGCPIIVALNETSTFIKFPQHEKEFFLPNYLQRESMHPAYVNITLGDTLVRLSWSLLPVALSTTQSKIGENSGKAPPDGGLRRLALKVDSATKLPAEACLVRLDVCPRSIAISASAMPLKDADELIKIVCREPRYTKRVEPSRHVIFESDLTVDLTNGSILACTVIDSEGSALCLGYLDADTLGVGREHTVSLHPAGSLLITSCHVSKKSPTVVLHEVEQESGSAGRLECFAGHEVTIPAPDSLCLSDRAPDAVVVPPPTDSTGQEISGQMTRDFKEDQAINSADGTRPPVTEEYGAATTSPTTLGPSPAIRPGVVAEDSLNREFEPIEASVIPNLEPRITATLPEPGIALVTTTSAAPAKIVRRSESTSPLGLARVSLHDKVSSSGGAVELSQPTFSPRFGAMGTASISIDIESLHLEGRDLEPCIYVCETEPFRIVERVCSSRATFPRLPTGASIFLTGSSHGLLVGCHEVDIEAVTESSNRSRFRLMDSTGRLTAASGEFRSKFNSNRGSSEL